MKKLKKVFIALALLTIIFIKSGVSITEAQSDEIKSLKEYASYVAEFYAIDKDRFFAVATCESQWNVNADNQKSSAFGLFQFLDGSWKYFAKMYENDKGVKLNRSIPIDNIRLAGWVFANDKPEVHWRECWK